METLGALSVEERRNNLKRLGWKLVFASGKTRYWLDPVHGKPLTEAQAYRLIIDRNSSR